MGTQPALPIAVLTELATVVLAVAVVFAPAPARAAHVDVTPSAGFAWGGTEKFDFSDAASGDVLRGDVHVNAATTYGASVAAYGRFYGVEVVYHTQPTEALLRFDLIVPAAGIDTSLSASTDITLHYIAFQIIRQYPLRPWYPFIEVGVGGAGLYGAGTSSWDFIGSFGGGLRRRFDHGGSLRLTVRMLAPLEIAKNGYSFGAANSGLLIGGRNRFFQGEVSLGYSHPVWGRP